METPGRRLRSLILPAILLASCAGAVSAAGNGGGPLSNRIASYEIRAELIPAERAIIGEEWVEFRNSSDRPLASLWFHLYPNAFRNSDTVYMR
jgi:hypothetical protein